MAEAIVIEIVQEVLVAGLTMPRVRRNKDGSYRMGWTRGDIELELEITEDGRINFELQEGFRDKEGYLESTGVSRGFLSAPSAIDQLLVVLYRPEAKDA